MRMLVLEVTMRQTWNCGLPQLSLTEFLKMVQSGNVQFRTCASNSSNCFLEQLHSESEMETFEFKIHADQTA